MRFEIELRCILFALIILEMFLQLYWSPPVFNSLDWTWFGKAHICLYKEPQLTLQSKTQAMRSKEFSVELRDRIMSRHRTGEGYQNISAALKVPKNTMASIILKWKKFGTTKTLPRPGHPAKLSKNTMVTLTEFLCGDGRTFQLDNHLCSTPLIRPLW